MVQRQYNDPRADHEVTVLTFDGEGATNVRIPYRGYTISLANDGADTCVYREDGYTIIDVSILEGTKGETIKKAMQIIDILED